MVRIIFTVTAAIALGSVIGFALRAPATRPGPHQQTASVAITAVQEEPAPASKEAPDDASPHKPEIHFSGDQVTIRFGKFKIDF
jgi:hypothetical protein